ncbi:MAG: FHA domain-containing protein [Hyphomicrobiaceae bacterium]
MSDSKGMIGRAQSGFLGSLRDALAAASRDETRPEPMAMADKSPPRLEHHGSQAMAAVVDPAATQLIRRSEPLPAAADAVREARAGAPNVPPLVRAEAELDVDETAAPTTRALRGAPHNTPPKKSAAPASDDRTQILRGKPKVARGEFEQDPVVGWLVVVGGPGLGSFRPIFEGNNTVGRAASQRVALDFGDDAISSEEQAYIRYDSAERAFLFVPNLAKTNIVSVNGKRPTAAVGLAAMDVILMGRTQLVFVPFCGADFDWSELADKPN